MTQLTLWEWVKSLFPPHQGRIEDKGKSKAGGAARAVRRRPAKPRLTRRRPKPNPVAVSAPATPVRSTASHPSPSQSSYPTKQALYDDMVRVMCARNAIRVKRWRTSMSGIAWEARYKDGSATRFIESPQPKSPMSAAIFLHEVGHHVLGIGAYKPRCLEEYHAWMYSLQQMEVWGIEVTDRVKERVFKSLRYAARKAQRRGIRKLPPELAAYV